MQFDDEGRKAELSEHEQDQIAQKAVSLGIKKLSDGLNLNTAITSAIIGGIGYSVLILFQLQTSVAVINEKFNVVQQVDGEQTREVQGMETRLRKLEEFMFQGHPQK